MSRPTLSLCMIAKDEEQNLVNCLQSVRQHVDELIVVDTGSQDRTREVAVSFGASVHQFDHRNHPEAFFFDSAEECGKFGAPGPYQNVYALGDFAAARNESFRHATCDYVIWMDADDVMEGAEHLPNLVTRMRDTGKGIGFLAYNYASDHLGRVYYRQWRERVFPRGAATWVNPVHEVLMPTNGVLPGPPERYDVPVYHHRRKADRRGIDHRNYKILLRQAWQLKTSNPSAQLDPRILFYLGQEARFIDPKRAVGFYEEYLALSGWPEERAAAHVAIGSLLEFGAIGVPEGMAYAQADREFAAAAAEMPDNPDGLFGLARVAYHRRRWNDCIRYTEAGLKIGNTDSMLGANPQDRLYRPHFFYNYALAQVGRVEEAAKSCEAGLKAFPDDPGIPGGASGMLSLNLQSYRAAIEAKNRPAPPAVKEQGKMVAALGKDEPLDTPPAPVPNDALVIWSVQLWKQIVASGDAARARKFLEALPSSVVADPVVQRMFQRTGVKVEFTLSGPLHPVTISVPPGPGLDVVFYLGPGPEPWTPNTPNEKGLGGSETAAIEMARELTKLGHRCVVYAEALGTFDGVEYRHHAAFKGAKCDVFVASRAPWAVEQFGPVDAKLKLLWVHDIVAGNPDARTERWMLRFDRILCLSNWHKEFFLGVYKTVHADKVVVTRNGIDPARFADYRPELKTNSMVFSSSPNRGLDVLLMNWPIIRSRIPDAELHIFYGFETWETMARIHNVTQDLEVIAKFKAQIQQAVLSNIGVKFHGKRPQSEVAAAYLRAKVWPYLTAFTETHCITALEAQAAGCVPVCSALAALPETVKHGVLVDLKDPRHADLWMGAVLDLMGNEPRRREIAERGRAYALTQSWSALAADWSAMFVKLIAEVAAAPLPLWRSA